MPSIAIRYEDEDFIVVDKASGLATQGGEGLSNDLISVLERQLPYRPYLVHRLDKDTSGLIMLAKHHDAAAEAAALLNAKRCKKIYLAVCDAPFDKLSGQIDEDLDIRGRKLSALTQYRVFSQNDTYAAVLLRLKTGRTHQIRRHLANFSHPVLADDKYGAFALNKSLKKTMGLKRLLLHAVWLELPGRFRLFGEPPPHFDPIMEIITGNVSWRSALAELCGLVF